ncbi:glycosyltransferase [Kribbella deserti]|uniref:Glycosyltransferase n=1 Tax=Kribbella deserti TaxID=1926257 RepID=A0ABV6QIJ3_9ACTN
MRVLVVHNWYRSAQPSGENVVVKQHVDVLRAGGHEVEVYSRSSDDIADLPVTGRALVPVRSLWSRVDERDFGSEITVRRPDVIHVHNTFPLISPSVLKAATSAQVPVVATLHNFRLMCANGLLQRDGVPCEDCVGNGPWAGVRHGCYRDSRIASAPLAAGIQLHRQLKTWHRYVTTFVAPSAFVRETFVKDGYDPARITVKPHSVPHTGRFRSGEGEHVLFVGRLAAEKGILDLLEAWDPALGQLVIAGDGPLRAEVVAAAEATPSITYLGAVSWQACMDLMVRARLLVVPARWYETFGMVVVEAFAHGVPVVAARIGALAELVQDGTNGAAFEPGDISALRTALAKVAANTITLGQAARALYLARFTPEADLTATEHLYASAVSGRRQQ